MGTKEVILETSLELFAVRGFEAVSISMITAKVGIAKSTLYSHFATKDEILDTVMERFESQRATLATESTNPLIDAVEHFSVDEFWHHILDLFLARWDDPFLRNFHRFIAVEQFRLPRVAEFASRDAADIRKACELALTHMMETGRIAAGSPEDQARIVTYGMRGLLLEYDALIAHGRDISQHTMEMRGFIDAFVSSLNPI